MASSNSYANINDIGNLRTLYNSFNTKLIDLEFADSPDAGKISKARDALAEIDERIVQLSALQDVGQSIPVVDRNLDKDIRERVSRIPEFDARSEVAIFIRECETVFDTLVKDQDSQVEVEFVRKLKCRLDQPYLAALNSSGQSMTTFSEFKSYMEANHQSKESHYQHLEKLEALEIGDNQNYRDYALKVDAVVDQIKTVVKARWDSRILHSQSVKTESNTQATVPKMTCDDLYNIFAGMYVLKAVKRDQTTYMAICHELDQCWSAKDVALKASNVAERKVLSNELAQPIQVNFTRNNQNSQPGKRVEGQQCAVFLKRGVCEDSHCKREHDTRLKFILDKISPQAGPSDPEKKSSGKNGSKRNFKRKGNYKPERKEANQASGSVLPAGESNNVYTVEPSEVSHHSDFRFPPRC